MVKLRLEKDLDPQHLIDLPAITTVETLYPNRAIQELALEVGDFVYVDKPEMSVWGFAEITGIEPAPAIEDGAGEVVTSTFKHTGSYVLDVSFEGQTEPIGVTATHPFWSPERQAFVAIGEMEIGETVQTFAGETKTISSKLARPGPQVVYNIEVDQQHVYFVGQNGLLVHNSSDFLAPKDVTVFRVQPRGGSDIVTGGAFRRSREGGANLVEANALRQKLLSQTTSADPKIQRRALVNAQASGARSPVISTTFSRQGALDAQAALKARGIDAEILTITGPRSGGIDFNSAFQSLGGRTRRLQDAGLQEFGIPDLFIPTSGTSRSGFRVIGRQ
ncbi:MAG: polymorphic toxin-type HINT domain-containing protein [Planctomycetota bacterium]